MVGGCAQLPDVGGICGGILPMDVVVCIVVESKSRTVMSRYIYNLTIWLSTLEHIRHATHKIILKLYSISTASTLLC